MRELLLLGSSRERFVHELGVSFLVLLREERGLSSFDPGCSRSKGRKRREKRDRVNLRDLYGGRRKREAVDRGRTLNADGFFFPRLVLDLLVDILGE